jgi:uncharacterized membrane protein
MRDRLVQNIILFVIVGLLGLAYMFFEYRQQVNTNNPKSLVMQTLNAQGFTDITVNWVYSIGICDSGEVGYDFEAVTSAGYPVQGVVCTSFSPTRYAYIKYR